ncbi:MAG: hypothetical protein HY866_04380 [Chloroflexi bacterium]|nr:hypothetical protein [Chloroflexota bacterium]
MPRIFRWLLVVSALLLLTACDRKEDPKPSAPRPTPMPAVITRIVTPEPTTTPLPTPTLAYDILTAEGRWILRFDLLLTNGGFAQEIAYNGFADMQVSLDGTILGSGYLLSSMYSPPCAVGSVTNQPLEFTARGVTYAQGEQVVAQVDLLPTNTDQAEVYTLICPDFGDVREFNQPLLWYMLDALTLRDVGGATMDRLRWTFALKNIQSFHFEADLSQETGGRLNGYLTGDVSLSRG